MDADVESANNSVSGTGGAAADGDHTPLCSPLRTTLNAQPGAQHTTHARRLKEYTRHRRTQDYRQLVEKLSFESAEYDRHRVTPGIDVWRVLGAAHADPSSSQHAEVVTRLPCRVRVPPTLLMRPAASDVFFYTDARGFLTRVDNASMRCFKALLRGEARHGDARHRERCDASEGRRTYSSAAPAHKPSSRLSSATGWVPSAGDAAPCVTIAVEASQQVAGVLLLPHGRGDSCVTSFCVSATVDGVAYAKVDDGTEYACTAWGADTPQEILFQAPVAATGIRLHPLAWRGSYLGVRVGLVVEPARRQGTGAGRPHSVQYPVAVLKTCVGKQSSSVCQALFTTEMTKANSSATDPQVLQEYVRSKGAYTTYYRCVWKPFADSHAYVVASRHRVDDRSQGSQAQFLATQTADQRLNIFRLRSSACREICEHTAAVAKLLAPCLNAFGAIETLVTDWVRDADDTWWMLQIKGWRLRPAAPSAGPSRAVKKSKKDAMRDANRRCGMCRRRAPTEARVTIAMINHTVRLLKAKGAWKHTHTIPTESGNNKYLTTGVCAACYKAYHREERAERLDAQLSAALGVSVSTELDRDANVEACAVPQEAPSDSFAKVVAAAALGRPVTRPAQADVHQWQLLLYFDRLYNLPASLIPSRLTLVVPGLLGITDTVPVPSDSPFLASATVPIRALKVRCFYTETRSLDNAESASPRLDPAVCRFLHAQQSVRVRLYYKTGPLPDERSLLGEAAFPLQQLSSGVVTKFSMLRMFSSTALGTCSLRLKVGLVRSSLRMTTGEKVVRHTDSGLYVPQHPVYAINALPAEWREVLAAEVAEQRSRPFGTHDGGGRGGGGGGQLLIGAGDGDDLQQPPTPPPVPPPAQESKGRPPMAYAAGCLRCSKSTRFQALCVAATGGALAVASATVVVASALASALGLRTGSGGEAADRSDFIDGVFRDTIEVCRPKRAAAKRAAPGPPESCEVCARSLGGLKGEQARAKRMLEYVCGGVDTEDRFKKLEQEHVVKAGQRRRVLRSTRHGRLRRTSQPHPPALSPSSTAFTAGPESTAAAAAAAATTASSQLTLTERLLRIVPPHRAYPGAAAASADSAAAAAAPPPSTAVAAWTGGASSERPQLKFGGCVQVTECRTDADLELPARFAAWRFQVSVRAVYGDLSVDVDPDTTWVTRYALFGREVRHKGFRLVESGPLLLQGDTTTYLFCHNNKTLVNYLRDAGDVLRIVVHREFEGDQCLIADVPLAAIEEALLSKRQQVPAVAGLFPLHKPSGLRAGVLNDLKVADASDSDDDGARRAVCEERRRAWRRRESGDEGDESSEGEENEEEERLRAGGSVRQRRVLAQRARGNDDSDDAAAEGAVDAQLGASGVVEGPGAAAPHLDVCVTACTTELLLSSVKVLRDLRPKHDIAIVSAGEQEEE